MSVGFIWEEDWLPAARCGGLYERFDRQMCTDCPVRQQCVQHALEAPWRPRGIWGGMTEEELLPLWQERHPNRSSQDEIFDLIGLYRDERGREPGREEHAWSA